MKTVNPEWEETFDFAVSSDDRYNADLVFQCFDKVLAPKPETRNPEP